MTRRLLPLVSLALIGCLGATGVQAKGIVGVRAGTGVTMPGSAYRYLAISPNSTPRVTLVERIDKGDGHVDRWWQLRGEYNVPAVAYNGGASGLSGDGGTLVLSRSSLTQGYPPKSTRLAILDIDRHLHHPNGGPRHAFTYVDLAGDFSVDAISPDGSTIYLIRHFPNLTGPAYVARYEVRAYDVKSGRLLPEPIVDPDEPEERMEGLPLYRATSPDGRWAYTLYDGNGEEPFIHALDTVAGSAVCIDLPQLETLPRRFYYLLQLQPREGGRELAVVRRVPGPSEPRTLLAVDTGSFEVSRPAPVATASSGIGPWPPVLALTAAAGLLLAWLGLRRRRAGGASDGASEQA